MDGWMEVRLDEVYDFSSGLSKKRDEFGSGDTFLTFKDVFYNYFVPEELTELVNSNQREKERCSIKRGDVFLTRTSETLEELGMSSVALKDYKDATFNGFTKRLRPKNNVEILPEYVGYYFRSPRFRGEVTSMSSMTTRASLNNSMLAILKLILPPIQEQKAIAHILSTLDEKIEINNKINKNLEEMVQTIFKQWFVDFEFPNVDGNPYKSSGGEMVESELGMIPKGWEVTVLADIIDISSGKRPKNRADIKNKEFRFPLVGASSIMGYTTEYNYDEPILVIGRVGTHGVVQRFNSTVWSTDNTLVIRSKHYEYTNQILSNIDYRGLNRGSTQPLITQTDIKNEQIILPSKNTLTKFELLVSKLAKVIDNNKKENITTKLMIDILLPKLISGKLRVQNYN